jgi:hypothetical protein
MAIVMMRANAMPEHADKIEAAAGACSRRSRTRDQKGSATARTG